MAYYQDDYIPAYNRFIEQNKEYKDLLTAEEWNNIINILSAQADNTATQMEKVHNYLLSGAAAEIPVTADDEPDPEYKGNIFIKIEN